MILLTLDSLVTTGNNENIEIQACLISGNRYYTLQNVLKTEIHLYKLNKICSCARKSGRGKNNAGTDKEEEEKKLAGPLTKKELPDEGCSR